MELIDLMQVMSKVLPSFPQFLLFVFICHIYTFQMINQMLVLGKDNLSKYKIIFFYNDLNY